MGVVRARGARAVLTIVVHNTKVRGGIPPPHGRPGIQFKHRRQSSYGVASVGGVPAIWFGSNEVWTHSANFAGGRTLNGTEHSNQGPSRTLNGTERSVRGVRGSNLGSELNFSITISTLRSPPTSFCGSWIFPKDPPNSLTQGNSNSWKLLGTPWKHLTAWK